MTNRNNAKEQEMGSFSKYAKARKLTTLLSAFALMFSLNACSDKSIPSSENLTEAINDEIVDAGLWIPVAGSSVIEGSTNEPFVIVDPDKNELSQAGKSNAQYLRGLIAYAKVLEQSGAISLKGGQFQTYLPFEGLVERKGYFVSYNDDLSRTLKATPYLGIMAAKVANLEVNNFVKTTAPYELDGQEWVDITVTLKYSQVLDCINTDVLRASYAMDEVNNAEIKFHLYLDDNAKRWKVDNKIDLPLDPVKKFYTSLVSKQNRN